MNRYSYKVLEAGTSEELAQAVIAHLSAGFTLVGGVSVTDHIVTLYPAGHAIERLTTIYAQAVLFVAPLNSPAP